MRQAECWRGSLTIGDGWAILEGVAGANVPHTHLAHQLTAGIDQALEVECLGRTHIILPGQYVIIPAGCAHAIGPAETRLRSLYIDRAGAARFGLVPGRNLTLTDPTLSAALDKLDGTGLPEGLFGDVTIKDLSAKQGRALIQLLDFAPVSATPGSIAEALGVSPSRLRQVSLATFGAPFSHVLQWRQLQHAARALSESASLAQAAEAGGFSDQSHFTRRMRRWFGVAPGAGLSGLEIRVAPMRSDC